MMPSADLISNLHKLLVLVYAKALQHGGSDQSMLLHLLKLFFGQSARFVQDLLVDSHLADIMKGRCHCDHVLIRPLQMVFIRLLHKSLQ